MKRLKKNDGAITMITLVTILFMVSFLISSYILISNKVKTQKEMLNETRKIYETDASMEEIYNSYFSNDKMIPIYNVEQLFAIGKGNRISINGKIYTFSNNATYILKNDIEFNAQDESLEQDWIPVNSSDFLDGNFTGTFAWNNHSITATKLDGSIKVYYDKNELQFPKEYQKVEYIESAGGQYINSKVIVNANCRINTRFSFTRLDTDYAICGYANWSTSAVMQVFTSGSIIGIACPKFSVQNNRSEDTDIHEAIINIQNKTTTIDDKVQTYTDDFIGCQFPLYIFARNQGNAALPAHARIYYFKIYDNNQLVRNFVPCYRKSDNKPGLYDLVNDEFYINQGSGDFIAGPKKSKLPQEYQQIEYLKSTGTQYIDTRYFANYKTDVIAVLEKETENAQRFFGNMYDTTTAFCLTLPGTDSAYIRYGNQGFTSPTDKTYIGEHTVRSNSTGYYIDGRLIHSWNDSRQWGNSAFNSTTFLYYNQYANIKLKTLIIKEDNTTIQELVPCYRKADNMPGMYDIVNDVFYTNQGSGDFIAGPNV